MADFELRELILILMELFEQLLDNDYSLFELVDKLQNADETGLAKMSVTSRIDKCIDVIKDMKQNIHQA